MGGVLLLCLLGCDGASLGGLALSSYLPPRAVEAPGGAPPVGYDVCR